MPTIQELQIQEAQLIAQFGEVQTNYNIALNRKTVYGGYITSCENYTLAQRLIKGCHKRVVPPSENYGSLKNNYYSFNDQVNDLNNQMTDLGKQISDVNELLNEESEQLENLSNLEATVSENQTIVDEEKGKQAGHVFKTYVLPAVGVIILGVGIWLLVRGFKMSKGAK